MDETRARKLAAKVDLVNILKSILEADELILRNFLDAEDGKVFVVSEAALFD
jgi:hypothetical protein